MAQDLFLISTKIGGLISFMCGICNLPVNPCKAWNWNDVFAAKSLTIIPENFFLVFLTIPHGIP